MLGDELLVAGRTLGGGIGDVRIVYYFVVGGRVSGGVCIGGDVCATESNDRVI